MDVIRQVVKGEGGVAGLYKGLVPTLLREVPGCSAMFAAYEAIKLGVAQQQVSVSQHPSTMPTCRCVLRYVVACGSLV